MKVDPMGKKSNKKTYKIGNQVLLNLEAVLSVGLDDIGGDVELSRNKKYLQQKVAKKLEELFSESPEFFPVAFKIKIINKTASSFEVNENTDDVDTE
jgi:hypothetical protein